MERGRRLFQVFLFSVYDEAVVILRSEDIPVYFLVTAKRKHGHRL